MTTVAPDKSRLLNILLADDGSSDSRAAVDLLTALPHARESVITAVRVFTPLQTAEHTAVEEGLARTKNLLMSRHLHVRTEVLMGYPADKLLEYAGDHHPDLVVMGAKGMRNTAGFALGGVAMHIVEDGRFPVLVARAPFTGLKRILFVTDGSECSEKACHFLGGFPIPEDASVDVLHVIPPQEPIFVVEPTGVAVPVMSPEEQALKDEVEKEQGQTILDTACRELQAHGIDANPILLRGDAATEIIEYARKINISLIIAGSRGLGTIRSWLLGSVSRKLVYHADCSVLITRCVQSG